MGIYLGQLPPAELARLKAELAETLVANFCYPRFFDYRTESLRMRPVDRAKRQEVWLYLSSVDFTVWSRVDLMSPDFQRSIERLLIQFVQRNRSFFGQQGRKRMSDIRMLLGSSATSVVQRLRAHITGQRQEGSFPFGSPRSVVSWSAPGVTGQADPNWEQIAANTMLLQQQLQELRGEIKPTTTGEARTANGTSRRVARSQLSRATTTQLEQDSSLAQQSSAVVSKAVPQVSQLSNKPATQVNTPTTATTPPSPTSSKGATSLRPGPAVSSSSSPASSAAPVAPSASVAAPAPVRKAELAAVKESPVTSAPVAPAVPPTSGVAVPPKVAEPVPPAPSPEASVSGVAVPPKVAEPVPPAPSPEQGRPTASVAAPVMPLIPPTPVQSRSLPRATPLPVAPSAPQVVANVVAGQHDNPVLRIGEDDIAIFEQMRHQLLIWLRVEAIHSGIEITGQGAPQLLELLQQQARLDETRLQVVSTLLNLASQVIRSGQVSVLDYKQALMFHLMHTRR
jgi:hypothetical protein